MTTKAKTIHAVPAAEGAAVLPTAAPAIHVRTATMGEMKTVMSRWAILPLQTDAWITREERNPLPQLAAGFLPPPCTAAFLPPVSA